ncbi:ABC transporter permease [Patulibacter sp.]|uniref:ABC transporter permease n=1 Tax=Patulibacter sp. TaxID=1912859 RepID=UPI0027209E55|nr:ABC transporter permease [Patulibacter sp.]MDO9409271.1 ABC transporter permease [Patulibacter sp.]
MSSRTNSPAGPVAWAFWIRSLGEVTRVRGALVGTSIAPLVFLLGTSGQFGRLSGLPGFPTDSYLSWIIPLCCLQGAGFAGAAAGANLARDIEQGWFDRLLVAPVARPLLILGPVLGAITRAMVPVTLVLVVGLLIGGELTGGPLGILALYVASVGFCTVAAMWGIAMAVIFRTQQAGPLMQMGVFLGVFLSTAYTPQLLLKGWLEDVARFNPVSHVLELGRQATVSGIDVSLAHTWPGLVALAGMIAFFGALAMVGLRRMGR